VTDRANPPPTLQYGATWIYPKNEHVAMEGAENLSHYLMGRQLTPKGFCKTCGVVIQSKPADLTEEQIAALPEGTGKWFNFSKAYRAINAKILNGVDLGPLNVKKIDGWNIVEPKYVNP
jgi:hypothetical protein